MKKENEPKRMELYVPPTIEIVNIEIEQGILAGSSEEVEVDDFTGSYW